MGLIYGMQIHFVAKVNHIRENNRQSEPALKLIISYTNFDLKIYECHMGQSNNMAGGPNSGSLWVPVILIL